MLDRIACIESFVRTVELGSFSAVAREQNTTQPTICKQIAALEEYLDVQLLVRSTRKVSLSDEGARFYAQCERVLAALAAAESSVGTANSLVACCESTVRDLLVKCRLCRA